MRADASQATLALALLVLGILLLKAAWLDHHSSLFRLYSPPGQARPASRQMQEKLGGQVALLGYDLDPATVRQGGEVVVRLYWQALQPLGRDYSSYVHLTAGPEQTTFAASDATHPGYIPTTSWHSTLYTVDEQVVSIPAAAPPVAMQVRVGLYDRETGARLGETVLPETVQTLPGAAENVTGRPEEAVALSSNGASPYVLSLRGANVIVWLLKQSPATNESQ